MCWPLLFFFNAQHPPWKNHEYRSESGSFHFFVPIFYLGMEIFFLFIFMFFLFLAALQHFFSQKFTSVSVKRSRFDGIVKSKPTQYFSHLSVYHSILLTPCFLIKPYIFINKAFKSLS